jgi:hypothetical protein
MPILIGSKIRKETTSKRTSQNDLKNELILMTSGIKFRKAAASILNIEAESSIWYAIDSDEKNEKGKIITKGTGQVYIYKVTEEDAFASTIGKTLSFHNKGLSVALFELAAKNLKTSVEDVEKGLDSKDKLIFEVHTTELSNEGTPLFELKFKERVVSKVDKTVEEEVSEEL